MARFCFWWELIHLCIFLHQHLSVRPGNGKGSFKQMKYRSCLWTDITDFVISISHQGGLWSYLPMALLFFLHQPLPLLWLALQHWPIFLAGTTNTSPAPHAQMNFALAFTAPGIYWRKDDFLFPGFQIVMVLVTNLISMALMSSFSADYNGLFYHPSCMGQQYNSLEYIASINIS